MNNVMVIDDESIWTELDLNLGAPKGNRSQHPHGDVVKTTGRILVVDDEPDIVFLIKKRLTNAGYEVSVAMDGAGATRIAMQTCPDVVLLDIGMPCGDGHMVADRIRSNPNTCFTPIIYLTARTSDEDRERATAAGAFAYITKPFASDELLAQVRQAISYWR